MLLLPHLKYSTGVPWRMWKFYIVETNVIHATIYGNENVFCQSDFNTIIFLMIQVIKINYKKKIIQY